MIRPGDKHKMFVMALIPLRKQHHAVMQNHRIESDPYSTPKHSRVSQSAGQSRPVSDPFRSFRGELAVAQPDPKRPFFDGSRSC
ncbi:hypothetical protein BQ8794_130019 [Mesorhizobium prunaredense]|uniref:Uncharacterized protein n=1 Tax=Mesorhizobium prunaredense TaxID=1631249 RepID=A0A1R3V459_9HYPH|nr:hypothetical protein BQ8794_130019 [Mesorhizobium prunaredense]